MTIRFSRTLLEGVGMSLYFHHENIVTVCSTVYRGVLSISNKSVLGLRSKNNICKRNNCIYDPW